MPPDAWYFDADRQDVMPFAILLEAALQPCGWLAAYCGAALTSPDDLCFRNLGGKAELTAPVRRDAGTLTTRVHLTGASRSAGMIIVTFDFAVRDGRGVVYQGNTNFGFFSRPALAQQVGVRDAVAVRDDAGGTGARRSFDYPHGRAVSRETAADDRPRRGVRAGRRAERAGVPSGRQDGRSVGMVLQGAFLSGSR